MNNKTYGGTIYLHGTRYWWKVKFPGSTKKEPDQIPLKPEGARFATNDFATAQEIAETLWKKAIFKPEEKCQEFTGTIASLCQLYLQFCETYYRSKDGSPTGEKENIEYALSPLLEHYGQLRAEDFGPLKLIEFRDRLIKPKKLCRNVINQRVNIIKRMYKWAVSRQLICAMAHHALLTVEALKKYRSEAKESKPVKPVELANIDPILPFATKTLSAMIQVQLHTGMRSGELVIMCPCDIDRSGEIWQYYPGRHKTEYLGNARVISIGPKAQAILAPFLLRPADSYCFSPAESCAQGQYAFHKTTNIRSGLTECYSTHTYANAIKQVLKKAEDAGVVVESWHPHRLRHTAATLVRKKCGRDAARAFLGQKNSRIVDTYAEIDEQLSVEAAKKIG